MWVCETRGKQKMQREIMSKKKSSQVHCLPSGDLMTASTSKRIPEIRLYKAWKGNNVIIYIFFLPFYSNALILPPTC